MTDPKEEALRFVVDGINENDGCQFSADGESAPFVVFDIEKQENVAGPFLTRSDADRALSDIEQGVPPSLDSAALGACLDLLDNADNPGDVDSLAAVTKLLHNMDRPRV